MMFSSWMWALVTRARRIFYPYLWRYRCRIPVVCIGNIHSGGSGKTPLVAAVIEHFLDRHPIVVSRGYRGRRSRTGAKISLSEENGPAEYGDEPWMLAKRLAVPVYVGKRRAEVLRVVEALEDSHLVVMDDGFQHLAVHRDIDIVTISADKKISDRNCLPLGELREPLSSMGRADGVCVVGGENERAEVEAWEALVKREFPGIPVFRLIRRLDSFEGDTSECLINQDSRGLAFCGIGSPGTFESILSPYQNIKLEKTFRDHHTYSESDIENLVSCGEKLGAKFFVTTEKDWIKVADVFKLKGLRLAYVRMKYEIPNDFWYFLQNRLES